MYGMAKAGLTGLGYSSVGVGVVALGFFIHSIRTHTGAFDRKADRANDTTEALSSVVVEHKDANKNVTSILKKKAGIVRTMISTPRPGLADPREILRSQAATHTSNFRLAW